MSGIRDLILILLILCPLIHQIEGGLTLAKECGDIICETHSFCSPIDKVCRPCEYICDTSHNNHDQNRCESDCQDYLHDIRYLKNESRLEMQIESELWTLKLLLGVTIGMTTTLMILTVIILMKLHMKRKIKQKKSMELPSVIYTNKYEKSSNPPSIIQGPENNNTGRFRREPSESTLPEYSTYDNPAMSPSPTCHV